MSKTTLKVNIEVQHDTAKNEAMIIDLTEMLDTMIFYMFYDNQIPEPEVKITTEVVITGK